MDFDKIVAVSGYPGLFQVINNRSNGLVVEDLQTGKVRFISSRQHQFTPLSSIAIFTEGEESSVEIKKVFKNMQDLQDKIPVVRHDASKNELMEYLGMFLPDFDKDQVFPSDVRKMIKWFIFLKEKDLLHFEETEDQQEDKQDAGNS